MNAKDYIFNSIYDAIEDRLDVIGDIKTDDAWKICKSWHYSSVVKVFAEIMKTMVLQKKAIKIGNGKYTILKPNNPPKKC